MCHAVQVVNFALLVPLEFLQTLVSVLRARPNVQAAHQEPAKSVYKVII